MTTATGAIVQARALIKRYGTFTAVREVSFDLYRAEILVLLGPNGAGKTTVLKLLAGLLAPTGGRVTVAGFDVQREPLEVKRRLAFLPDQPFLHELLTVTETIGFIGGMYRLSEAVLRERATKLLDLLGLSSALHRRIGQLSFGMRSRLVLLMSLLHRPEVLVLDEPFFGLDPQTLRLMKQLLTEHVQAGMAVMLSTHQLPVIDGFAHRVAVMHQGSLVANGTLQELARQHPGVALEELFFRLTAEDTPDHAGPR